MNRLLLVTLVFTIGARQASASFDLMYLPDGTGRVQRWDPVNRVFLGQLDVVASATNVVAHSSSSTIGAHGQGGLQHYYNGSSGEYLGFNTGATAQTSTSSSDGTTYWNSPGALITRTSFATGGNVSSFNVGAGFTVQSLAEVGNRIAAVVLSTAGDLSVRLFSSSGTLLSTATIASSANLSATANARSAAFVSSNAGGALMTAYWTTSGQLSIVRVALSGDVFSVTGSFNTTVYSGGGGTANVSLMAGHGGSFWVVGRDSSDTSTRIRQFAGTNPVTSLVTYTTSAVSVPTTRWNGSNVVAPEPGTLAALGLGLAAVGRRMKKKPAA